MRVAVVTPYYKEATEVLERCHETVLHHSVGADHILIAY